MRISEKTPRCGFRESKPAEGDNYLQIAYPQKTKNETLKQNNHLQIAYPQTTSSPRPMVGEVNKNQLASSKSLSATRKV